jgi:hypothetical protein
VRVSSVGRPRRTFAASRAVQTESDRETRQQSVRRFLRWRVARADWAARRHRLTGHSQARTARQQHKLRRHTPLPSARDSRPGPFHPTRPLTLPPALAPLTLTRSRALLAALFYSTWNHTRITNNNPPLTLIPTSNLNIQTRRVP